MSNDKKIKRWTNSRILLLTYLKQDNCSVQDLYELTTICVSQIYKTLRAFVKDGLVDFKLETYPDRNNKDRKNTRVYKATEAANEIETFVWNDYVNATLFTQPVIDEIRLETIETLNLVKRLEYGVVVEPKDMMVSKLKRLIGKTHPDRVKGYETENVQLIKALTVVKNSRYYEITPTGFTFNAAKKFVEGWGWATQEEYELIMLLNNHFRGDAKATEQMRKNVRAF